MRVAIVVPWRGGCEHRERAWNFLRPRYRWPVIVAEAPGSRMGDGSAVISGSDRDEDGASLATWCKAEAVMPAIEDCSADVVVVADADCWTEGLQAAVEAVEDGAGWAIPHAGVFRLSERGSERYMAGEPYEGLPLTQPAYRGLRGGGFVVARRETLLEVPLDHRFVGWGQEDESWGEALTCLLGEPWRGREPVIHLWHPPQARTGRRWGSDASRALRRRYFNARDNPDAMRSLLAASRPNQPTVCADSPR